VGAAGSGVDAALRLLREIDGSPQPASDDAGLEYGLGAALSSRAIDGGDPLFFATHCQPPADEDNRLMWYAIEGYDAPQTLDRRMQARAAHLARLVALKDAGRLLLAGPCPAIDAEDPGPAGFSGSIVIAEFDSLEAARTWADADPYVEADVYARIEVRPFRAVLP
jgi:uncharacterized protein